MDSQKVKVWTKFIGIIVIFFAILLVIFMNRNNKVDVWVFHRFEDIAVLWVILISAVGAVIGLKCLGIVRQTINELKQLKKGQ